jgi:hypothetical protein
MRTLGLVIALIVTLSIPAAAQASGHFRPGLDLRHASSGGSSEVKADTSRTATLAPDPYLQRYYSHSEGWTYYNLPAADTARKGEDEH